MRSISRGRVAFAVFTMSIVAGFTAPGVAQDNDPEVLLGDIVHYIMVARPDMAAARAQQFFELGLTDAEIATILDEGSITQERWDTAIARARNMPQLEDIAAQLERSYLDGELDLARDPARIDEAIEMLLGGRRQQRLAEDRLTSAGEYAVPALLRTMLESQNDQLRRRAGQVMVNIGRLAIAPLCTALPNLDETSQLTVCNILGDIGWPHAAPYLRELEQSPNAGGPVRDAAGRAFNFVGGDQVDVSSLFTMLSKDYFDENESLIAYPFEPMNNIWTYDPFAGLIAYPVPTDIFSEVMCMRTALSAVEHNQDNSFALSLFVAANLRRENQLPDGEQDIVYGDLAYTPDFYATVFGTQTCMDVLDLALESVDTQLVRDAISALSKTTGGSNLFAGDAGYPLLEALQFPDRRVQYDAALVLGNALPKQAFEGDFRVVPTLASAVRTGNRTFTLVIADESENRQVVTQQLIGNNFDVIGSGRSVDEVRPDIDVAPGVDLVVLRMTSADRVREAIAALRAMPRTAAAPILVLVTAIDQPELFRDYRANRLVLISLVPRDDAGVVNATELALQQGAGGRMTEAEAEEYAILSLEALERIAISESPVYNIIDAEGSLIDALATRRGAMRDFVARILARLDTQRSQRELFDTIFNAESPDEQQALLTHAADSVKRYGSYAESRHVAQLRDLVRNASGDLAEAAARLHGAMKLPPTGALDLLPPTSGDGDAG